MILRIAMSEAKNTRNLHKHQEVKMRKLNRLFGSLFAKQFGPGSGSGSGPGESDDFVCSNGASIPGSWECDGMCDCEGDGDSDEAHCDGYESTWPLCIDY